MTSSRREGMAPNLAPNDTIEVVYALPDMQRIVTVPFEPGLTAWKAVERSGLAEEFPGISMHELVLGLYGHRVDPEHILAPGDRVEICRPLERDPRELRRELLRHGLVMGASGPADRNRR